MTHFIPGKTTYRVDRWAQLYIREIVRLHGVPVSIVSDRDTRFTSQFWKSLQKALGTQLRFSTTFHPQMDVQTERLNQILEDMLRACVMDSAECWDKHLPLIEFAYNNSYQATIQTAPFEALYGRRCQTPVFWEEVGTHQLLGPELSPRFIGPFEILERVGVGLIGLLYLQTLPPFTTCYTCLCCESTPQTLLMWLVTEPFLFGKIYPTRKDPAKFWLETLGDCATKLSPWWKLHGVTIETRMQPGDKKMM